jgi:hypothetical protein
MQLLSTAEKIKKKMTIKISSINNEDISLFLEVVYRVVVVVV